MQGPQRWGAPPPQLSQEARENRKSQPEGAWRPPLLRCPPQTPLSPCARPPSHTAPACWTQRVCWPSTRWVGFLGKILCGDSLSLQARGKPERAGLLANSPHGARGERGHTGVSGGFSTGAFSGLAPPPRVKPQTKTARLAADLQLLPGAVGTR